MSHLIDQLISAFKCLPGVGPKSAQRMTYHLLERDRQGALELAQASKLEDLASLSEGPLHAPVGVGDSDHIWRHVAVRGVLGFQ